MPKIGVDRFTNYIQVHCVSFPFDQMAAMTALVSGGVFDRHPTPAGGLPRSRAAAGCRGSWNAWASTTSQRGDWIPNGWRRRPRSTSPPATCGSRANPTRPRSRAWSSCSATDCVMFASDYPHWDGCVAAVVVNLPGATAHPGGARPRRRRQRPGVLPAVSDTLSAPAATKSWRYVDIAGAVDAFECQRPDAVLCRCSSTTSPRRSGRWPRRRCWARRRLNVGWFDDVDETLDLNACRRLGVQ